MGHLAKSRIKWPSQKCNEKCNASMDNVIQLLKHCVITSTSWFYFIGRWSSFIYFFAGKIITLMDNVVLFQTRIKM